MENSMTPIWYHLLYHSIGCLLFIIEIIERRSRHELSKLDDRWQMAFEIFMNRGFYWGERFHQIDVIFNSILHVSIWFQIFSIQLPF